MTTNHMAIKKLLTTCKKNTEKISLILRDQFQKNALNMYRNPSIYYNAKNTIGTNVFERDWDTLIVLDSCRVDALRDVSSEYDFLSDIGSCWSVGGQSAEWIAKTFDEEYIDTIRKTTYVTSNPHAETVLVNQFSENWKSNKDSHINRLRRYGDWNVVTSDQLNQYEDLWKYEGEAYKYPPRYVTDRAIQLSRNTDFEKMILHYMPPHTPYTDDSIPDDSKLDSFTGNPFDYLKQTGDEETTYGSCLNMLRWVLDEVELLLDSIDAEKVAITADHGDAFGEYSVYYHHAGSLHPQIRRVPWTVTTATDTNSYTPSFSPTETSDKTERTVEESLKALGYL